MSIKYTALAGLLTLACASAEALTLSDASLHSHLGEPLVVRISVSDEQPLAPHTVRIRLGSREEARTAGIDSSDLPADASLSVEQHGPQLQVTIATENRVSQPFINFLLVVESTDARLERQYTLLLDLPN